MALAQPLPTTGSGFPEPSVLPVSPSPGPLTATVGAPAEGDAKQPSPSGPQTPGGFPLSGQPLWAPPTVGEDHSGYADEDDGEAICTYRFWARPEYLLWWVKPGLVPPPLATTGVLGSSGIIGRLGTNILIGGSDVDYDDRSGARLTAGLWLDKGGHIGIEASGFVLEDRTINMAVASDATGVPLLGRPVRNALTMMEANNFVSFPSALSGRINVSTTNELWGAEANFVGSLYRGKRCTADMLVGFRYVGLDEDLTVSSVTSVMPGGAAAFNGALLPAGSTLGILDRVETRNDFYGGQIGAKTEFCLNRIYVSFIGKLAVGNAHETVNIRGSTTMIGPAGAVVVPGGLLAVASNSGLVSRDDFTFIPEAQVKLGFRFTKNLSAYVGYSMMYWFDVARPGEQIDRTVNPVLVPSNLAFMSAPPMPPRPAVMFQKSDFWAQGVNIGVEIRY
jgi:hypothetical protein